MLDKLWQYPLLTGISCHRFRLRRPEEYANTLRKLAKSCEFGTTECDILRNQISGKVCNEQTVGQTLVQEEELTLERRFEALYTMLIAAELETIRRTSLVMQVLLTQNEGELEAEVQMKNTETATPCVIDV